MADSATIRDRGEIMASRSSGSGTFERLILLVVSCALAIAAALVLLLAANLIEQGRFGVLGAQVSRLVQLAGGGALGQGAVVLAALVVGSLAALAALRALGGSGGSARSNSQRHVLVADDKGIVVVEAAGVATVARAGAKRVGGVIDVRVRVVGSGAAPVRLELTASVSAAAELRRVGDEVRRRASEAVQSLVGIDVSEVVVKIDVVPLEELGRGLE